MSAAPSAPRSLSGQLSTWLALQTFVVLSVVGIAVYTIANWNLASRQDALLEQKGQVVHHLVSEHEASGKDYQDLQHSLTDLFSKSSDFFLTLKVGDTKLNFGNPVVARESNARQERTLDFQLPTLQGSGDGISASLSMDVSSDAKLRTALAWALLVCALGGAAVVSACTAFAINRSLVPLEALGRQAEDMDADSLGQRLSGEGQALELQPLIEQFNSLLQRLEIAYLQLESFNMDVAHELRTPLATLVGNLELSLTQQLDVLAFREVVASSLEDAQHMAEVVNDMLFLSRADRGVQARRSQVESVARALEEVVAYHEAEAAESEVIVQVTGEAQAAVDRKLLQRAVSNLLSNALRYANRASTVEVNICDSPCLTVRVVNKGESISAADLPMLFHRFYRADSSRRDQQQHHGLGLAIVAAIARMHGGRSFASCQGNLVSIGFTLPGDSTTCIRNAI
ncbi:MULTISPECIES: heavy metal sensor histidine kinase [Achromobacter]|uniref:heavy metal sensor histidine kinase n=1 Tax=Achromobacter TaxID=222 RepID=UPI001300D140|nr:MULTISPECIES: heavy metal sensor histidine kinase [Achromobacter]MCH1989823.1 heavy metal sensor histidine kinase [Achromobacter xylosoxidans]MCH1992142.1 heavy metal sensor histidine kinase [Achromobacter xylosoxidans]MCH4586298.1 heavy metal sensor histidine kinase [Achromobacter xylosoxidans]